MLVNIMLPTGSQEHLIKFWQWPGVNVIKSIVCSKDYFTKYVGHSDSYKFTYGGLLNYSLVPRPKPQAGEREKVW